jgi:plasmid stabilization system protein ParE
MAKRKVVWTLTAAKQRNAILRFWVRKNQSNTYSKKILELSNRKASYIARNPLMYRHSDYPNTRVASMGHFSIFYKVESNSIIITAFWDNRQDPIELHDSLKENQ